MAQLVGRIRDNNLAVLADSVNHNLKNLDYDIETCKGRIIIPALCERIEVLDVFQRLGDRLLPGFGEGVLLCYDKKPLHPVLYGSSRYSEEGAIIVNLAGEANLLIEDEKPLRLSSGECWKFNNRSNYQFSLLSDVWWSLFYFYIKPGSEKEYFPMQKAINSNKYRTKRTAAIFS